MGSRTEVRTSALLTQNHTIAKREEKEAEEESTPYSRNGTVSITRGGEYYLYIDRRQCIGITGGELSSVSALESLTDTVK